MAKKISGKKWRRRLLRSSLSLLKAIALILIKFYRFAVGQILLELTLAVLVIGFSYLLTTWGMPLNVAFILAIALTLTIVTSAVIIWFKFFTSSKLKGELKLASLITHTLANKTSREWEEYQDWLHDIMLYRQQLLTAKRPRWQVSLITYWYLGQLVTILGISKIRKVAASIKRSL